MSKIACILGARREAIQLATVILLIQGVMGFRIEVCVPAQPRQIMDPVLCVFGIRPGVDLDVMGKDQTLSRFTASAIEARDSYFCAGKPDLVLGDTSTVFCPAPTAFHHHALVGHFEADLRTGNMMTPWPEEANRVLTTRLSALHFAPTPASRDHLQRKGVAPARIHVTGNTVIDALHLAVEKNRSTPAVLDGLPDPMQAGAGSDSGGIQEEAHNPCEDGVAARRIWQTVLNHLRMPPLQKLLSDVEG